LNSSNKNNIENDDDTGDWDVVDLLTRADNTGRAVVELM